MTTFDVVLVSFPFADLSTRKQRPCLVLVSPSQKQLGEHLVVAMITSNTKGLTFPYDVQISNTKQAGVLKPSLVRLSKVATHSGA